MVRLESLANVEPFSLGEGMLAGSWQGGQEGKAFPSLQPVGLTLPFCGETRKATSARLWRRDADAPAAALLTGLGAGEWSPALKRA